MNTISVTFGWMFVALAVLFSLGLTKQFARAMYPASPGFLRRLAAPIVFAVLAAACFAGITLPALTAVAIYGITQILLGRSRAQPCPR